MSCKEDPLEEVQQPTPVFSPGESHGQRGPGVTVHRAAKSWTWLKRLSTHAQLRAPVAYTSPQARYQTFPSLPLLAAAGNHWSVFCPNRFTVLRRSGRGIFRWVAYCAWLLSRSIMPLRCTRFLSTVFLVWILTVCLSLHQLAEGRGCFQFLECGSLCWHIFSSLGSIYLGVGCWVIWKVYA